MKKVFLIITLFVGANTLAVPYEGSKILIVGASPLANIAGEEIAKKGGNVFDVAVTMGLVMTVTNPQNASLGGGGFALISSNNNVDVLDFREKAPVKTNKDYYIKKIKTASTIGGTAVGVPGFAAGLWAIHQKYGKIKWKKLFKRALEHSKNGIQVSGYLSNKIRNSSKIFSDETNKLLKNKKNFYKPGEILKQRKLHKVLYKFRNLGPKAIYEGQVAKDIVNTVQKHNGHMNLSDLKNYKVRWLKPLKAKFKGHEVYLMPPPSSGGYVIKTALHLIEKLEPNKFGTLSVNEFHLLGEIFKASFRGRSLMGDPDFHKNPLDKLFSERFLNDLESKIKVQKVAKFKPMNEKKFIESKETTHFNVMDKNGNAISLTVTLNGSFGSGVSTKKYGITLNNEMDDFTTRPGEANMFGLVQGSGNHVEPGKRPLSSMSPTIVKKDGKVVMSIGAPGGPRIITGVIQAMYRVLVSNFDVDAAIQAPRVHHQFLPNNLFVDKNRFSPQVLELLNRKGHKLKPSWMGRVNAIYLNNKGNLESSFDSRGNGSSRGY